jgi:hypothetical protein
MAVGRWSRGRANAAQLPALRVVRVRAATAASPALRFWMVALLCPLLVLSTGLFSYISDIRPLYLLTKAWPVLTVPFAAAAIVQRRLPGTALLIVVLVYVLIFTPFMAMAEFGVPLLVALQPTAKMTGLLNYFATFEILCLLRPSTAELRRTLLCLGVVTFGLMWLLWIVLPVSDYATTPEGSMVLLNDAERGPRIYAPMIFGFLLMFSVAEKFFAHPRVWRLLLILGAFVTLLDIYKQKLAITAAGLVIILSAIVHYRRHVRLVLGVGLLVAAASLMLLAQINLDTALSAIGGSLETRLISGRLATGFMQQEPLRWLTGVGSIPQHDGLTLGELFRFPLFFLSDLGWIGVLFEYGVFGTSLIIAVYVLATVRLYRLIGPDDAWSRAMLDYAIYLWLVFTVYSAVAAPGELLTLLALATYMAMPRPAVARHGPVPVASRLRPRLR